MALGCSAADVHQTQRGCAVRQCRLGHHCHRDSSASTPLSFPSLALTDTKACTHRRRLNLTRDRPEKPCWRQKREREASTSVMGCDQHSGLTSKPLTPPSRPPVSPRQRQLAPPRSSAHRRPPTPSQTPPSKPHSQPQRQRYTDKSRVSAGQDCMHARPPSSPRKAQRLSSATRARCPSATGLAAAPRSSASHGAGFAPPGWGRRRRAVGVCESEDVRV